MRFATAWAWSIALAVLMTAGQAAEQVPLLTVSIQPVKITVDGELKPEEWQSASGWCVPSRLDRELSAFPGAFWVACGEKELFVAVRSPLPQGQKPKAGETKRDGNLWEDDAVELFLSGKPGQPQYYQFIVNSAGAVWDSRGKDGTWNARWTAKAKVAGDAWTAEVAIPYGSLGLSRPQDGTVWGFNVGFDRQTPYKEILSWAPVQKGFHDPANFGRLAFRAGAPAVQLTQWERAKTGELSLNGAGGGKVVGVLSVRQPDGKLKSISRSEAQGQQVSLKVKLPMAGRYVAPGEYLWVLSASAPDGKTRWARLQVPLKVAKPVDLTTEIYPIEGSYVVHADLRGLGRPAARLGLMLEIRRPDGEALLRHDIAPVPEGLKAEHTFDLKQLGAGHYELWAMAREDGKELYRTKEDFERPGRPAWLGSQAGVSDRVLPPWTPVQVKPGQAEVWNRSYSFGPGGFLQQVTTQQAEILAGPVLLRAKVGGKEVVWKGEPPRPGESTPAKGRLAGEAEGGGLRVKGQLTVEYDGLVRHDFEITGSALDSLLLEIPFKAEHAKYLYHFPGRWRSAYNAGAVPEEGWAHAFKPYVWLGDEERGMCWFSESDRNWFPQDPQKALEVVPEGKRVVLRLNIIGQPQKLEQPLKYTFGYEATPVKPMFPENRGRDVIEDVWDMRISHAGSYGLESRPWQEHAEIRYPAAGNINLERGTVEMWVTPAFDPNVDIGDGTGRGRFNRNLFSVQFANGDILGYYWNIDDRGMRMYVKQGGKYPIVFGHKNDWQQGETHHIALTWGDEIVLYADGQRLAARQYQGTLPGDLATAEILLGGGVSEFSVDELRISDVARAPGDLTKPLEADEHTLLLDRFDEKFEPDGERMTQPAKITPSGDWTGGRVAAGAGFVEGKFGRALRLFKPAAEAKTALDRLQEAGVTVICFHEHWTDIQNYTSTTHGEQLKKLVKACHEHGIRLVLYFGYEISNIAPEWPLYSAECLKFPRGGGYHRQPEQRAYIVCYNSPWQDFMAEGIARMMDEYDIDGVYLDGTANPWICRNVHHGCGYRRPDGTIGDTCAMFATREMMRRIYTIVKSRKPNGIVNVHQSTCMTIPTLAFATSYWDGEQFGSIARGANIFEILPLDAFRCEFMGHQWGVPAEFLCYNRPYTYAQAFSFTLLHDVLVRPGGSTGPVLDLASSVWKAMQRFGRKQSTWYPYWRNQELVNVSPAEVKCSLYSRGKRGAMLIVSNLGDKETTATLRLNVEKLGLSGLKLRAKELKLRAKDAREGTEFAVQRATIEVPLGPLSFRMIEVKGK